VSQNGFFSHTAPSPHTEVADVRFLRRSQQRLARNINDLLQELRVAQAGVQILFGFLLSIVFTGPYQRATALQHGAHLVAVLRHRGVGESRPGDELDGVLAG
jgi:Family of unknown function (DUF6328)